MSKILRRSHADSLWYRLFDSPVGVVMKIKPDRDSEVKKGGKKIQPDRESAVKKGGKGYPMPVCKTMRKGGARGR
jgi:hypothetical protein